MRTYRTALASRDVVNQLRPLMDRVLSYAHWRFCSDLGDRLAKATDDFVAGSRQAESIGLAMWRTLGNPAHDSHFEGDDSQLQAMFGDFAANAQSVGVELTGANTLFAGDAQEAAR